MLNAEVLNAGVINTQRHHRPRMLCRESILLPILICFVASTAAAAGAQQGAAPDPGTGDKDTQGPVLLHRLTGTPDNASLAGGRVRLDVVVTDAAGKPVSGLTAQDFSILADKQPMRTISFEAYGPGTDTPEQPVEVIIVIDAVNNGFSELSLMRQGLVQFLRQNGGHLAHPVSLILFAVDGVEALAAPSTDGNALAALVARTKPRVRPRGVEPFPLSMTALGQIAQDEEKAEGRKLLIWLGPGWEVPIPDQTVMTPRDEQNRQQYFDYGMLLSTRLRQARITLYGGYADDTYFNREFLKGVRKVTDEDPRDLSLGVLALQSGGRGALARINRDSDVADQLESFVREADTFYRLSFDPPEHEPAGDYRDLKVIVDKPGLTARTNAGYYNQPASLAPVQAPINATGTKAGIAAITEFVGKPVTVAELEALLSSDDAKKHDSALAKQLYELRLTERLSTPHLGRLQATLPGVKSRQALVALADASSFHGLPPAEIPSTPAPDLAGQRRIVALAVDYLRKTIPRLPNFFATRTTDRYEDTREDPKNSNVTIATSDPLHFANTSVATVIYRDHKEVVDAANGREKHQENHGLVTRGTFGPILTTVMIDASHGEMSFSHWETGAAGQMAVFKFSVPPEQSHYEVAYQSAHETDQRYDLNRPTGYHGEISVDPTTGAILRLALEADFAPGLSLIHADIMVEYGAVDISGKIYICPVKSVSYSQGRAVTTVRPLIGMGDALGPSVTRLNDVAFSNYHVFRTEMKILTGDDPATQP